MPRAVTCMVQAASAAIHAARAVVSVVIGRPVNRLVDVVHAGALLLHCAACCGWLVTHFEKQPFPRQMLQLFYDGGAAAAGCCWQLQLRRARCIGECKAQAHFLKILQESLSSASSSMPKLKYVCFKSGDGRRVLDKLSANAPLAEAARSAA